jgi:hypothetical protein
VGLPASHTGHESFNGQTELWDMKTQMRVVPEIFKISIRVSSAPNRELGCPFQSQLALKLTQGPTLMCQLEAPRRQAGWFVGESHDKL